MDSVTETSAFDWLDDKAAFRQRMGLQRHLRPRQQNTPFIDVMGNDYLGLSRHPDVCDTAIRAVHKWGAGATGSRLVSGTTELHQELEGALAQFHGAEAALVFSSGYTANLGAVTALCGPDTLVIADRHNHASLVDAARLTAAEVKIVNHNAIDEVHNVLAHNTRTRALVVTESIFSVDGDAAPLRELHDVTRQFGAALIIDDAHGFGVVGDRAQGLVSECGLANAPDVVTTVTLSKAFGSQGGAVLGSQRVIDHLINGARSFLYDTGLAPAAAGAARGALQVITSEPQRAARVRAIANTFAQRFRDAGMQVHQPAGAVVSITAPSPSAAVEWASSCRAEGVAVGCFRPPSVPDRISRLRLTARADLTDVDVDRVIEVIIQTRPFAEEDE
jgi:8-amino-7-oxononanoate synthase